MFMALEVYHSEIGFNDTTPWEGRPNLWLRELMGVAQGYVYF